MSTRTIIITGTSRGIGFAAVQSLLEEGARVVGIQRSATDALAHLVDQYPSALHLVQGDCGDEEVIARAVREAQAFGSIDGVVFNAGKMPSDPAPVAELPLEAWEDIFDINFYAVIRLLRAVLPIMSKGSKLIFVSSALSSVVRVPAAGPYSASKSALESLNRTLSVEHPDKVCISFLPGAVRTQLADEFNAAVRKYLPDPSVDSVHKGVEYLEPEVPGRHIARLVLRAPGSLSGKIVRWDDAELNGI